MTDKQQKNQMCLAFPAEGRGEAPSAAGKGTEAVRAGYDTESQASPENLMEEVCQRDNLVKALKRVKANKGSPGIDGMKVEELSDYLKENWPQIQEQLLTGCLSTAAGEKGEDTQAGRWGTSSGHPDSAGSLYPTGGFAGAAALLGPDVLRAELRFSPRSLSASGSIPGPRVYWRRIWICGGYRPGEIFDRVNHDILMSLVAKRVQDKRVLKLLRAYLNAGVMENGLVSPASEGTPQGGPLSPLLSNLMLDVLDKELERRGHRFVRYADDCNIYVRSLRAGERVMAECEPVSGKEA